MLHDCALSDIGYSGHPFTWCNNHEREHRILKRLNWVLANPHWQLRYPNGRVVHGYAAYSDHCPIWRETHPSSISRRRPQPIRFEAMWVGKEQYTRIIDKVWTLGLQQGSMAEVMGLINRCGTQLRSWNITVFGNVQKKLDKANPRMQRAQDKHYLGVDATELKESHKEVQVWLEHEELMCK